MPVFKSAVLLLAVTFGVAAHTQAQNLRDYMNQADHALQNNKVGSGSKSTGSLSQSEVSDGLRQALQIGAQNATKQVSAVNGFFGNALIKVLMPPEAKKVETTLREIGMGSYVDDAILSMNRAAEDASSKAVPIFINAIKSMSIQDAFAILKGGDNAATNYLKSKTTAQLTEAFRPVIQESLDKVDATKYWTTVFTTYNELPTTFNKVNPDL